MPIAPKFYLFKQKEYYRIQVSISAGKRIREYTDIYVDEKQWDKKRQRCKPLNKKLIEANTKLQEIEDRCLEIERKEDWNNDVLKRCINSDTSEIRLTFFQVFDKYIEYAKTNRSTETAKKWNSIKNRLQDFQKWMKKPITFEDFNMYLYDKFIEYYSFKAYANNTTGRHITFVKSFMQWSLDRGYHNNTQFLKWKSFSEEADLTFMEESELMQFKDFPFEKGTPQYNARENHCFRCFTGMRYSDTKDLHPSEINVKEKKITKTIYKTGDRNHVFPLSKYAMEILERNDYKLTVYSSQKENVYLQQAAKAAELDRPIKRLIMRGSKRDISVKPLHEVITTHMGKRTFITLSLMRGVPERVILKIVGNKDYKSIEPYIKIVDKHSFEWMEKAWG